ncbi:MAG TPA: LPS export ABC transporter permease LptG [Pseudomonadota bacterium]|nr:LPS export ABC transporter permease LptG [Pseudomonadota bacterium]
MRPLVLTADRLVGASVLGAIALVWAFLVAFDAFVAFGREIDEIGRGGYTLGTAAAYIAWTVPRRAYELFGTAAVIGGLLGMGSLAPTSELTALRAGGLSTLRISLGALAAVALLAAFTMAMGETLASSGERRAQSLAAGAKSRDLIATGRSGLWVREGETLINARRGQVVGADVELHELRIYQFTPRGELTVITLADSARHHEGRWQLRGVVHRRFTPERVVSETQASMDWPSTLDPRLLTLSIVRPRYLSIADLRANIAYLRANDLDASTFESAYWGRIFYPLSILALVFAALPFAFGTLRSGGFGKRLFFGIVMAVGWYFFQRMVANLAAVYAFDHRLVNLAPSVLLGGAALAWFRYAR